MARRRNAAPQPQPTNHEPSVVWFGDGFLLKIAGAVVGRYETRADALDALAALAGGGQ